MADDRFGILVVCTANICRSPIAERLLRHSLGARLGPAVAQFHVSSAGTEALVGEAIHPHSATMLDELGARSSGFHSRAVTPAYLSGADLVLTATRAHRAACVSLAPATIGRTFTLKQLARLANAVQPEMVPVTDPVARARWLIAAVPILRPQLQPVAAAEEDLLDPIGRPIQAYRVVADETQRAVDAIAGVIAGTASRG